MKTGLLLSILLGMLVVGGLIGFACTQQPAPTATTGPAPVGTPNPAPTQRPTPTVTLGRTPTPIHTPFPTPTPRPVVPIVTSDPPDGYVALAPRLLRSGQTEGISVSLFSGQDPAMGVVQISLAKDGNAVAQASGRITGSGIIDLPVPTVPDGMYQLRLEGPGFQDQVSLKVEAGAILFLETDKPIYKPGQTVLIRALSLNPELKPLPGEVTVEIQDAKGIKVFKTTAASPIRPPTTNIPNSMESSVSQFRRIPAGPKNVPGEPLSPLFRPIN